jgi:lipopolysaccharide transport system ATP-binding protein
MEPVIKVEGLSKRYDLRREGSGSYSTLRDSITGLFRAKGNKESFWALDDVNFEIHQGERVGIIGRNGAGKSTLLKVLSRIVHPTKGRITLEGRIASLLEVGTGFHPELSGRENIFLNGSILGMSKAEIKSRFDEIVAFSEVERFLDTPVKRYSSGMYVRLAFAVAAHLDPEILIVDEVLAVGDAEFQRKCLGKMKDVAGKGRTVILVSHNMAAIQHLCERAIYMRSGKLVSSGPAEEVISTYLKAASGPAAANLADRIDRTGNGRVRFQSFALRDKQAREISALTCGGDSTIELMINNPGGKSLNQLTVSIGIDDELGVRVAQLSNELTGQSFSGTDREQFTVGISIPRLPLKQGRYNMTIFASVGGEVADWIQDAIILDVDAGDFYGSGKLPPDGQGHICIDHRFELKTGN